MTNFIPAALTLAHAGHDHASGVTAGFAHPWLGLDHLLAMLAVGLLAVRVGGTQARWFVPAGFLAGMTVGAALSYFGTPLPGVEFIIAGSVIVLGLAVALLPKVVPGPAVGLVAFAGLFHGHAHITEMAGSAVGYASGMLLATAILHALGVSVGLGLVSMKATPAVRLAGAAMAVAFAVTLPLG